MRLAWFITSGAGILALNKRGHQVWKPCPKRGIPAGAYAFGTETDARLEIHQWKTYGRWPLVANPRPIMKGGRHPVAEGSTTDCVNECRRRGLVWR